MSLGRNEFMMIDQNLRGIQKAIENGFNNITNAIEKGFENFYKQFEFYIEEVKNK